MDECTKMIGVLPDGMQVFASIGLLAQVGEDCVRYDLVDSEYIRRSMTPPGYHKIRTRLFSDDYVLVKANSFDEALSKYLKRSG